MTDRVIVIGAGLAGCEAAWALAKNGIPVVLYEMKPAEYSPAHKYSGFAELVCSNSLKALRIGSAAGMLKEEMRRLGSLTVACALENAVPAGGALAVDRTGFSDAVTERIMNEPGIGVVHERIDRIPDGNVIIATGPLTAGALAEDIGRVCGGYLSFYDAAAPIVTFDSIDTDKAFFAARYGRGGDDYINCPFTKEEYIAFHHELVNAESAPVHDIDRPDGGFAVYEGCMPIEVLAKRGEDAVRYGAMKPVGLTDPHTGRRPYAAVQLRKENAEGTLYNIVGFQTNLKFGEQKRVFSMIPGLENAEFMRYGVMHRNSFIKSPGLLNADFSMKSDGRIFFAGQMTGVEGYMESAAAGMMAGINMSRRIKGLPPVILPRETMTGALSAYISDETVTDFQPMGANMGILPPPAETIRNKQERYGYIALRGLEALRKYCAENDVPYNE